MSSKKVLVVLESIDVNKSSGAKVNVALINNLITLDYEVTVLHYTRKDIQLKGAKCIAVRELKFNLNYFLSRCQRLFQRIIKLDLSKRLENSFGQSFTFFNDSKSIKSAINVYYKDHDLILTLSQGASFRPHYAMLSLPNLFKKWLAYVHDPYPFHLYPNPYNWSEPGYKKKIDFFRKVSEKAQYSAFPSLLLKEWMGSYYPNFLKTGIVIPHQHIETGINDQDFKLDYFNSEKFTLLHAGNLMKQRSPVNLIKGFKSFLDTNSEAETEVELMLIGPASYHKTVLEEYNNSIPQLYLRAQNVPFKEIQYLQKRVNVNIILESESEISPFLPGKFPHCVFANKAILAIGPKHSETERLLGEDYEFHAEAHEDKMIANKIEKLYNKWKANEDISLNRPDLEAYLSPSFLDSILKEKVFI